MRVKRSVFFIKFSVGWQEFDLAENTKHTEGEHGHDSRGNEDTEEDGGHGFLQPEVQKRRHQRTGPRTGAG